MLVFLQIDLVLKLFLRITNPEERGQILRSGSIAHAKLRSLNVDLKQKNPE